MGKSNDIEVSKLKLLVENMLIYGIGGIVTGIIPLVMVPIITHIMPGAFFYGLSDLSDVVISFGRSIALMGMYDAMFRLYFDSTDENHRVIVCSTALRFTILTSVISFIFLYFFRDLLSLYIFGNESYEYIIVLCAGSVLASAISAVTGAPSRMENHRTTYIVINTLTYVVLYGVALVLLLQFRFYDIAIPVGTLVSYTIIALLFFAVNKRKFDIRKFDTGILKELLAIGIPVMPSFLVYWIYKSCDKVMIANILGLEQSGIYSAACKIGMCSQLIYQAFVGGWQFFAFSTMKEGDQVRDNSIVFEWLGVLSCCFLAIICVISFPLFKLMFKEEYMGGYICVPYLFLSPLILMLYQIISNQFLVIKKTWPSVIILFIGAVMNILLNRLLIPIIGIEGASLSTLAGYICSLSICMIVTFYMKLAVFTKRFFLLMMLTALYIIVWRFVFAKMIIVACVALGIYLLCIIAMYKDDVTKIYKNARLYFSKNM